MAGELKRHRTTLIGLEGETIYVEGPDPAVDAQVAEYYSRAPERWRGRYFIHGNWGTGDGVRRVFTMHEARSEDGNALLQWDEVTDPAVLERVR